MIGVGEGVGVGVGAGVGVGVGVATTTLTVPTIIAKWIEQKYGKLPVVANVCEKLNGTVCTPESKMPSGDPVLKKPTVVLSVCGGWSASNRKLYKVPQRIAFAFWFCAKVSELQVRELEVCADVQAVPLNPVFPTVPSLAQACS